MIQAHKKSVREAAIAWFLRMQQMDIEHPDRSKFEAWLMLDASHQQAYQAVSEVWEGFDSTSDLKSLDAAMAQKAFLEQQRSRKLSQSITGVLSILLIAVFSLFGYHTWQAQPTLEIVAIAEVGQVKAQTLEDGTKLNINANSEVEVTYYRNKRLVKLNRGEVIFEVARDESRPFIVDSGYGRITVLGTRFAVNRLQKRTRVSVDHGRVQFEAVDANGSVSQSPLILKNGEVAELQQNQMPKRTAQCASDAFSFAKGTISFDKAGLDEIAETLSRYRKPAVRLQSSLEDDTQITAVIKVQDIEKFIANLPDMAAVQVKSAPQQTLIIPSSASSH